MSIKKLSAVMLAVIATSAMSGNIVGSKHDFSALAGVPNQQICIACHTPHNAATLAGAPLWNHTLSTATYTAYTSSTMNAATGAPGSTSKLCLSCHDGTVAVNSFGGASGVAGSPITGSANLGTNLSDDHPIGIDYTPAVVTADGALWDPATKTVTVGEGAKTKNGTINAIMLFSSKVECASCHDVHNTFTADAGAKLVRVTTKSSQLCLTCHDK